MALPVNCLTQPLVSCHLSLCPMLATQQGSNQLSLAARLLTSSCFDCLDLCVRAPSAQPAPSKHVVTLPMDGTRALPAHLKPVGAQATTALLGASAVSVQFGSDKQQPFIKLIADDQTAISSARAAVLRRLGTDGSQLPPTATGNKALSSKLAQLAAEISAQQVGVYHCSIEQSWSDTTSRLDSLLGSCYQMLRRS